MIKFPSINQFRNVIRYVKNNSQYEGKDENGEPIYNPANPIPILKYRGTVKIHGTNAGIVYDVVSDTITYQSRERVLSLTQDNAGFMLNMMQYEESLRAYFRSHITHNVSKVAIFGEWCGRGIQKGVAVNEVDRMFVVFAKKIVFDDTDHKWVPIEEDFSEIGEVPFRLISEFPSFEIDIDFNYPEIAQQKMIEIVEEVERECPVGKAFGVSGVGEGVVWTCVSEGWDSPDTWFKTKGEKHSVSKVKTLSSVDVEEVATIKAFVDLVVTEVRLEQGLDNLVREQLKPIEMKSMGDFIRWVFNDIMKEEQDTIVDNGLDPKKLGRPIANAARSWFVGKVNEGIGL